MKHELLLEEALKSLLRAKELLKFHKNQSLVKQLDLLIARLRPGEKEGGSA